MANTLNPIRLVGGGKEWLNVTEEHYVGGKSVDLGFNLTLGRLGNNALRGVYIEAGAKLADDIASGSTVFRGGNLTGFVAKGIGLGIEAPEAPGGSLRVDGSMNCYKRDTVIGASAGAGLLAGQRGALAEFSVYAQAKSNILTGDLRLDTAGFGPGGIHVSTPVFQISALGA